MSTSGPIFEILEAAKVFLQLSTESELLKLILMNTAGKITGIKWL